MAVSEKEIADLRDEIKELKKDTATILARTSMGLNAISIALLSNITNDQQNIVRQTEDLLKYSSELWNLWKKYADLDDDE